jgi:energy-coupling factor transporter ATP-binding protein EcfA2
MDVKDMLPKGSWFIDWLKWFPHAEPPSSFKLFTAMAMMGGILGRKVCMSYDVHEIRPMLNLLLIGPSGIGKSTSVKMARKLLEHVDDRHRPQFIEGGATREKLHHDLRDNPHAMLFAPELAAFFSKETYKEGLIPYVTNLLDYEDRIELRTRKDGIVAVENPEVSIIGASTRDWLQSMLPDSAVTGGFLARFLLLSESEGKRTPNPHRKGTDAEKAATATLREAGGKQFYKLINNAFGRAEQRGLIDYVDDYSASDAFDDWYLGYKPDTGLLSPFAARAPEMVLRMAIILAVSCDRYELTAEDIRSAIKLYEYQAKKLGDIVVPVSQQGRILAMVMDAIPEGEAGILEARVYRALRNVAGATDLAKVVMSLVRSGDIELKDGRLRKLDVV